MDIHDTSTVKEYKSGDYIRHQDLNTFGRIVKGKRTFGEGQGTDADEFTNYRRGIDSRPIQIRAIGKDIEPYSLFCLKSGEPDKEPIAVAANELSNEISGSPLTYYTNGQVKIPEDKMGWADPIQMGERVFCRVSENHEPKIGYPCGIETGSFDLSIDFAGFVCLSAVKRRFDIDGVWATIPQRDNLVAVVIEEDVTAYDITTKTLGTGKVRVQLRDILSSDVIDDCLDPDGPDFFDLDIHSISESVIPVDTTCVVHAYSGVGMLAIPIGGTVITFIGWVETAIPAGDGLEYGSPGTTSGTNVRLQQLDSNSNPLLREFEDCLDSNGNLVRLRFYNMCLEQIDASQRIQGKTIKGDVFADVVCCPP